MISPAAPGRGGRRPAGVLLAAESLRPGHGGICRVARLMARVLAPLVEQGEVAAARALSLNDPALPPDLGLAARTARGSRPRFVAGVHRAALTHSHVVYDFLGMARAHPHLPFLRRPFAVWLHGIEVWEQTRPDRLRAAARATTLFCNTHYTRARADRLHGGFARAKVCWLATESDQPGPERSVAPDPPTVLMLGTISHIQAYKGHDALIACWPEVLRKVPDARLLIVGAGPRLAEVRALAAASPAADRIEFRGFVPDAAMPAIWDQTSVLAMPSRGEGFGLVYIEAMQRGIPVLASVHDAAGEVNLDGQTGYNVDLDRPGELPDRLIRLLDDPAHAAALGRNGRRRWAEHFTYDAFARRFTPLLREFLAG
jgi:phosphatidyl-myo-inositol dimannoside synthase